MGNVQIYNYANLNKEDKKLFHEKMNTYLYFLKQVEEYNPTQAKTTWEKLYYETAYQTAIDLKNALKNELICFIESKIRQYPYDVPVHATTSFLYGYTYHKK